jgi:hypothetical protein
VGQKTVLFSDLSGQLIMEEDIPARIVIHEHPELSDGPVEIEAMADEAKMIEKSALRVAIVDVYAPGDDEPRRVVMHAEAFDKLATDRPMSELLITARPAKRATRSASASSGTGDRANYGTVEHAGKPHKGKTTDAEKRLVRERFDEVNERLSAQGIRTISLSDPEHVERYGLEQLAQERAAATNGSATNGNATNGSASNGNATKGSASNGNATKGSASNGSTSSAASKAGASKA